MSEQIDSCQKPRIASTKRCTPEDPQKSLPKLVALLEEPISSTSFDRHIIVLNDFLAASTSAFWVRDLPYIMRLLELLTERMEKVSAYKEPLKQLLKIAAVPPLLTKSSEALTFARDLQEYFSVLGYFLVKNPDEAMQELVAKALCELLKRPNPMAISCVSVKTCQEAVEESELPKVITQVLEIAHENLYVKLLELTFILVKISKKVRLKMLSEKVLDHLIIRMDSVHWRLPANQENVTVRNYKSTSRILWALLKTPPGDFPGPGLAATKSLMNVLKALIKRKGCESKRNHIMAIVLQCLHAFPDLQMVRTGLARDIATISVATEYGTAGTWAAHIPFGSDELDYEFKKMLLLALCYCAKQVNALKIMKPNRIIPALIKLVTPDLNMIWHPQQQNKLFSMALRTLQVLIVHLPNQFVYYNGPATLLILLDCFAVEPYDINILRDCLNLVNSNGFVKHKGIINNVLLNGGKTIIKKVCRSLLWEETHSLLIQRCLAHAFSILTTLSQSRAHVSDPDMVNISKAFLKRIANPHVTDPVHDPKFVICALDFFWETVVWSENNLKLFVDDGGTYILLDVFQTLNFSGKLVALGALVDMCDEGSCIPYLVTWRKNGQSLLPMLLELFREENVKIGTKTTRSGTIADIELPLMGQQQWYETFVENKDPNSSPAIIDLLGSCRPKIYAIIQLLETKHSMRTDIANKQYRLYDMDNLSTQNQLTLFLAENFLALKLGETWVELKRDIEGVGLRPLAVDGELLRILTHRFYKWALHLKKVQETVLNREKHEEGVEERLLYNILKESKLGDSLKALRELHFIARTTEKMFRLVITMKRSADIENSLNFRPEGMRHRTYMHKFQCSPVFGQIVSLESNVIIDPKAVQFDVRPVSPDTEEDSDQGVTEVASSADADTNAESDVSADSTDDVGRGRTRVSETSDVNSIYSSDYSLMD